MFEMIVACSPQGLIGKNNALPWPHNKDDMKWFKERTKNKIVIMGSKTFESVLRHVGGPLKQCVNLVMTSKPKKYEDRFYWDEREHPMHEGYDMTGVMSTTSKDFLHLLDNKQSVLNSFPEDFIVCGGTTIYRWFLEHQKIKTLYLTRIDGKYEGDAYVPFQSLGVEWSLVRDFKIEGGHVFELRYVGYNPSLYINWMDLGFTEDFHKSCLGYDPEWLLNLDVIHAPVLY